MEAIKALRDKFGGSSLFGNEKDDSFKSSIGQIYQTFGGEELYPSVEEGRDRDVDNIVEGTGSHAPLSRHQEPLVQQRQQTYCRHAIPVVDFVFLCHDSAKFKQAWLYSRCSIGFSTTTASFIVLTAPSGWQTTPLLP